MRKHGSASKTYLAASKALADLPSIAEDYQAWENGQKCTLGFETILDASRWDVEYREPVDFSLADLPFSYRIVPLANLVRFDSKRTDDARVAVHRWGKVVWLDDAPDGQMWKSNFFLSPLPNVNPLYLYLYLSSSAGRQAIERRATGVTVPNLTQRYLAELPVILPELPEQGKIAERALKIRQMTTALEALALRGKQALSERLFQLDEIADKFSNFAESTEKAFHQTLPFPIAFVYRKLLNASNGTQRFSLLIELFEAVVRFIVLINIADYLNVQKDTATAVQEIPELSKLSAPALGDWVSLFRSLSHYYASAKGLPFLKEMKHFKVDEYARILREFVNIRNESLRGHGSTLSEQEYEIKVQEHSPKLFKLVNGLGFLANYRLLKTGAMEKHGEFFKISVQNLMGDNPNFINDHVLLRTPLESSRVLYLNMAGESLALDPYILVELCPVCTRSELLVFDKFMGSKNTYLSYESGHKPPFSNVERLPLALRELATRRFSPTP